MFVFRSIALLLLTGMASRAQTSGTPVAPPGLLARIKEKMAVNLSRLPNYTCLQTTERSHRDAGKKRFERQDLVRLEVALVGGRELFAWPGAQRIEESELGNMLSSGPYGNGNFALFARTIFLTGAPEFAYGGELLLDGRPTHQFQYRVPRGFGEYHIRVNERDAAVGYHGVFWVDALTLDLLRLEVNADDIPRSLGLSGADDWIRYVRTRIGDADFLLPQESGFTMRDLDGNENRNHTTLGQCRQFRGESVLSFEERNPAADAPAAGSTPAAAPLALPETFRVDGFLEAALDADSVAVGDPVSVHLTEAVKTKGKVWIPKGAKVRGRVVRAEHAGETFLLRFHFDLVEFENAQAGLQGRSIRCRVTDATAPNSTFRGEMDEGTLAFAAARHFHLPRGFRLTLLAPAAAVSRAPVATESKTLQPAGQAPARGSAVENPVAGNPKSAPREPVLHAETTAVSVDAIVTGRKGRHVSGLSPADFRLFEDGVEQTISSFTPAAAPGARGKAKPMKHEPGGTAGRRATEVAPTPQLITLLVDLGDLHLDGLARACDAASQFVRKTVAAGNLVSIYWIDSSLHLAAPFTSDQQKALAAIDSLRSRTPAGPFTIYERESAENEMDLLKQQQVSVTVPPGRGSAPPAGVTSGGSDVLRSWIVTANALQARAVFVALRAMALAYRGLPGRKTVVVLSEGFLHAYNESASLQAVIDAANRANVAIYMLDASGMSVNASDRADKNNNSVLKAAYDRPDSSPDLGGSRDQVTAGMNQFDWLQSLGTDHHSDLGWIATATGGFVIQDTNDLGSALDRVEEDASEYYTLVYSPSNRNYDGAYRRIKVDLTRRGLRVRHRNGYWAFPPGHDVIMTPAAAQLLATVASGERKPSFAPELKTALVAANGGFAVAAAVSMPGQLVHFEKLLDREEAAVTVLILLRDAKGALLSVHENWGHLSLTQAERSGFSSKLFNWQGHIMLPEYPQVAVQAIVTFGNGTLGASVPKVLNPEAEASGWRAADLVLADAAENTPCRPSPADPLCVQGRRLMLPAEARFPRSATIQAYFAVSGASTDLQFAFRMGSGEVLSPVTPAALTAIPSTDPQVRAVLARFELGARPPGTYSLELTASAPGGQQRVTRGSTFVVE